MPDAVPLPPGTTVRAGQAALRAYATPDRGGVPVLFLHANVCDARMWAGPMAALAPSRRVVAFDRRGFGETPRAGEPYVQIDDAVAVMDALQVGRAVLVGSSNGGRIAIDTALAHPDRVAGLVLVCGSIGGMPWDGQVDPRVAAIETRFEAARDAGDRAEAVRAAARLWLDGPFEAEGRVGGDVRALFVAMMDRVLAAPEDDRWLVTSNDAYARLATIRVPTLVVQGMLDEPVVVSMMEHAAATIPGAGFVPLADTAHLPSLERPDLVTPRLATFVAALD